MAFVAGRAGTGGRASPASFNAVGARGRKTWAGGEVRFFALVAVGRGNGAAVVAACSAGRADVLVKSGDDEPSGTCSTVPFIRVRVE